jgi:hypothetical protein
MPLAPVARQQSLYALFDAHRGRRTDDADEARGVGARSHCRFAPPLIHSIPDPRTYSVHLVLKQQCDRTPGGVRRALRHHGLALRLAPGGA